MTHDPKPVADQNTNWTTVVSIIAMTGIFIIFVLVLWKAGFLSFRGDDPSSKVVAAALALVGGLVAAIGTIVGVMLKYSIDQRTESRLQIEADRANALQTQAEQRLNLEAAIRAIELLAKDALSDLQRAGALFALSNLNQHDLVLDLTAHLLENDALQPNVACTLIDRALTRGEEEIQHRAIDALYQNAERMVTSSNTHVPPRLVFWDERLPLYVRGWAPSAFSRIILARPLYVWQSRFLDEAATIIGTLGVAWQSETDPNVKDDIGAILKSLLAAFSFPGNLSHPNGQSINFEELKAQVAGCFPYTVDAMNIVKRTETWRASTSETTSL